MEVFIIIIYILGVFITNHIIYKDGEDDIDHNTASIACVAWPVALLIYGLLSVEKLIRRYLNA